MQGRTYGLETWSDLQLTSWWRLSPSMTYLQEKFSFKPGSSGLLGTPEAADDPKYQAALKSSMDLAKAWMLDLQLRYVSDLPSPHVASYTELNGRLSWTLSDRFALALRGGNLLQERHSEYVQGAYIPRSVLAVLQCRF
jgi:iron complex outermembrane receptor protein